MGEAGEAAVVERVRGKWCVDPARLGQPFAGRAALLSPFDRLVHDRRRTAELFAYEYQLEMTMSAQIGGEIEDLARWLELELVLPG